MREDLAAHADGRLDGEMVSLLYSIRGSGKHPDNMHARLMNTFSASNPAAHTCFSVLRFLCLRNREPKMPRATRG